MTTIDINDRAAVEREARRLYEAGESVRPSWDQLGDTTKGVWRKYAQGVPRSVSGTAMPQLPTHAHLQDEMGERPDLPASAPTAVSQKEQPSLF